MSKFFTVFLVWVSLNFLLLALLVRRQMYASPRASNELIKVRVIDHLIR